MARRAAWRRDGGDGRHVERPLFARLHRRGPFAPPDPSNDNRPAGLDRLRRLLAPARGLSALIAWIAGRR